ncbi:MAG: hypothetical protein ACRENE_35310, partial [Polyangiaceae bacterium]
MITTDLDCPTVMDKNKGTTSIRLGTSSADVDGTNSVGTSNSCSPDPSGENDIGTFVVVPNQGNGSSDSFAILVTTGSCKPPDLNGCIVARRELSFLPHTPLTLPIAMDKVCLNVTCPAQQTCVAPGTCVSDKIDTSGGCSGGSCTISRPNDAGSAVEGSAESSTDAGPDVDHGMDASMTDQSMAPDVAETSSSSDAAEGSAPEASSEDGPPPVDGGGVVGTTCIAPGSPTGVACNGSTCAPGEVCCADWNRVSPSATESCKASSACPPTSGTGGDIVMSLACRNQGDCPTGHVCCGGVANAYASTCVPSGTCPVMITGQRSLCHSSCECGALTC